MAPAQNPTQSFVPVKEVLSGVMVLKEGGYRGVLMCSSVNFALKSADEQRAIITGFQNFLNTLDFSIEIVVHSREMDIRPYLGILDERLEKQKTELMRIQLREYIGFVRAFTEGANIMMKMFYVVVPYSPSAGAAAARAFGLFGSQKNTSGAAGSFDEHRIQLEQRLSLVAAGLTASGIRAIPLGTEEVIELLYRSFNPGAIESPIRLET